jgi:hypothetical protein
VEAGIIDIMILYLPQRLLGIKSGFNHCILFPGGGNQISFTGPEIDSGVPDRALLHDLLMRYFFPPLTLGSFNRFNLSTVTRCGLTNHTVGGIITSFIHRGWWSSGIKPGIVYGIQNYMAIK